MFEGCPFLSYPGHFCFVGDDTAVAGGSVGVCDGDKLGFGEGKFFV